MNAGVSSFQWPLIIAGLIVGLFGWLLYWAGIPIIGGIIGAIAGGSLGIVVSDLLKTQANQTATFILPLMLGVGVVLGAVLGVLLMRAIQVYFFFAAGASLGGALGWRLLHMGPAAATASSSDWGVTVAVLLCALTGGLLMVYFRRFLVALATSTAGVVLLMYGMPPQYQLVSGIIGFVIFISVQIGLVSRFVEQEEFDHRMKKHRAPKHEEEEEE